MGSGEGDGLIYPVGSRHVYFLRFLFAIAVHMYNSFHEIACIFTFEQAQ
jgi:hypothetical protein